MTKIRGEDRSVKYLLGQKFWIDYYQRDYKLDPKQIRELVEDLTTRFLQDYEPHHERRAVAQHGQYFFGSIIMSEKDGERFIVDGQQLLTSLTLLLIYFDWLQKERPEAQRVDIAKLIYSTQYGTKSFNLDVAERNACLQALIDGESPDPTEQLTRPIFCTKWEEGSPHETEKIVRQEASERPLVANNSPIPLLYLALSS